jgi:hypothetical protein
MPPGLYELVLTDVDPDDPNLDLVSGKYVARLEPRTLDDIRALGHNDEADERRFETVARVSEISQGIYRSFGSPIVKSAATSASAEFLREMHPNRVRFRVFSDSNPVMRPIAQLAEQIRADRHPVDPNNPLLVMEKIASSCIVANLDIYAKMRAAATEAFFLGTYGSPLLQAMVGLKADHAGEDRRIERDLGKAEAHTALEENMERGGLLAAGLRGLVYILRGRGVDERQFNALDALRNNAPDNERVLMSQLKEMLRQQAAVLRADESRALKAIPKMLPNDPGRRAKAIATIFDVVTGRGEMDTQMAQRFDAVCKLFGVEEGANVRPFVDVSE